MKFLKIKAMLLMLAMFGVVLTSCEESATETVGDDPVISSISPAAASIGETVTITGANYGAEQSSDYVTFNGVKPAAEDYVSWTDTSIEVKVPAGASSGPVVVSVNDFKSNEYNFSIGPKPATGLCATSKSATEVMLFWDASVTDTDYDLVYDVIVTAPGADPVTVGTVTDLSTLPYTVTDLTEGVEYTFEVAAKYSAEDTPSSVVEITWSPASRFVENINESEIRIYETASDFGSGLDLYDDSGAAPKSLKVASIASWNLGLYTTDGTITFGSASQMSYNGANTAQITEVSDRFFDDVDALSDVFDSEALDAGNFSEMTVDLSGEQFKNKKNIVFVVRTQDPNGQGKWNYAKVMVKLGSAGFLQGDSPNRYLEFEVSYQKTAGVPYAK